MSKDIVKIFCDGSVNPQKKIGYGAYFILESEIEDSLKEIKNRTHLKKFDNTSSTKLELEVILWALEDAFIDTQKIIVYTDCQNILGLDNRREKLESSNYTTSSGKKLKNHELYKKFFIVTDKLNCSFEKVKGHKKTSLKNNIDKLFNIVDKASRKALRDYLTSI